LISGLGWSFRGLPSATPRGPFRKSGTEGSNPLCSSGESANHRFLSGAIDPLSDGSIGYARFRSSYASLLTPPGMQ